MKEKSKSVGAARKSIDVFDVVVLTDAPRGTDLRPGDKAQVAYVWPDGRVEVELPKQFSDVGTFVTIDAANLRRTVKEDYPKPKRHPDCECGSTTAYCDLADRYYCPRCDLWLERICSCTPEECQYAERALWQRRPSRCEHCEQIVQQERAAYEASPTAERSVRIRWCRTDDEMYGKGPPGEAKL